MCVCVGAQRDTETARERRASGRVTHRLLLGLPVQVEAQERVVDLQSQGQRHETARLDLVLSQVQAQQPRALCDEFRHGHGTCEGREKSR